MATGVSGPRIQAAALGAAGALGAARAAAAQELRGASRRLRPLVGGAAPSPKVHELADGRLVLVEGDRAYLLGVRVAADGEHALAGSGRVVVQHGRAVEVVGTPAAAALLQPSP